MRLFIPSLAGARLDCKLERWQLLLYAYFYENQIKTEMVVETSDAMIHDTSIVKFIGGRF